MFWFQIHLESRYCTVSSTSWFLSDLYGTCSCPSPFTTVGSCVMRPWTSNMLWSRRALRPSWEADVCEVKGFAYFGKVNYMYNTYTQCWFMHLEPDEIKTRPLFCLAFSLNQENSTCHQLANMLGTWKASIKGDQQKPVGWRLCPWKLLKEATVDIRGLCHYYVNQLFG